jgi:flagellar basal body-associated protein FliL
MAKEDEVKPAAAAGADDKKAAATKGSKGMLAMVGVGLGLIVVSAAVTFFTVKSSVPKEVVVEKKEGEGNKSHYTYALQEIYVNIAETKGTRILKIVPILVLSEERLMKETERLDPLLRDRVSYAASAMTIDQLEGGNGREALKREIMNAVNAALKDEMLGAVVDVYFSDYLIQ